MQLQNFEQSLAMHIEHAQQILGSHQVEATGITLAFAGEGRGAMDPVQGPGVEVVNITPTSKLCTGRFIVRGVLGIS